MAIGNGAEDAPHLILASGSRTRQHMLQAAGVAHTVCPADLDERAIEEAMFQDEAPGDMADLADVLARAKAEAVSAQNSDSLVIGSDQVLALGAENFHKPTSIEEARRTLLKLRGKTHQLHTGVALAQNGEVVWSYCETAHVTMRDYSEKSLAMYLVKAGDIVLESVGAYQIEGLGLQLMDKIDGSHFTVLGMPLLPLIKELRNRGVVEA